MLACLRDVTLPMIGEVRSRAMWCVPDLSDSGLNGSALKGMIEGDDAFVFL